MGSPLTGFCLDVKQTAESAFSKGAFHLFGSMALIHIIGFPVQIFLARYLGPEALGHIAVISTVINFVGIFSALGVGSSVVKFVSEPCEMAIKQKILFHALVFASVTSTLAMMAVMGMCVFTGTIRDSVANGYLKFVAIGIPFAALSSLMITYLQGLKQITRTAKIQFHLSWTSSIVTVAAAYFWRLGGYIITSVIFGIITSLVVLRAGANHIKAVALESAVAKRLLGFGAWGVLANSTSQIVITADIIVLSTLLNDPAIVGNYKVAVAIIKLLQIAPLAVFDTAFPYMSERSVDRGALREVYKNMFTKMALLVAGICAISYLFGGFAIRWVFGDRYMEAIAPFNILLLGFFLWAVGGVGGRTLLAMGKPNLNFYTVLFEGILNVALNIVLIRKMGVLGAAWATAITYFSRYVITILLIRFTLFRTSYTADLISGNGGDRRRDA
jgi:O-antigen/teichoic acid export membrane protein